MSPQKVMYWDHFGSGMSLTNQVKTLINEGCYVQCVTPLSYDKQLIVSAIIVYSSHIFEPAEYNKIEK